MRLKTRVHEWLADHISWVQYPNIKPVSRRRPMAHRLSVLTWREKGWLAFYVFWGSLLLLAVYGNLID